MFRRAEQRDLAKIVGIYNQTIESRTVTADLTPVTVAERESWFAQHAASKKHPLWVYELNGEVIGWCSYSPFYGRAAYDGTAEISFYLDRSAQGKGFGKQFVAFLIEQMPHYQITTLLAFVFGNNTPSLALLRKCGFNDYGRLPAVADMQTHWEDLVILGFKKHLKN